MSREPDEPRPEAAQLPMSADGPLDSDRVAEALASVGVPLSCAEAHGLACGLLCTQRAAAAKSRWFTELLDAAELDTGSLAAHGAPIRLLDAWFVASQEQLDAPELVFEPALPPDDAALGQRIDALGDFCAGFTYGIGIGVAARGNRALPADTRELLEDFQSIDGVERASTGAAVDDAGSEADYVELVEYVRVGVLVILEELKPVDRPGSASPRPEAGTGSTVTEFPTDPSRLH